MSVDKKRKCGTVADEAAWLGRMRSFRLDPNRTRFTNPSSLQTLRSGWGEGRRREGRR